MKSINFYKSLLMEEIDEKKLSKKQMDIADEAPPYDEITGADFKALKAKKSVKEMDHSAKADAKIDQSEKEFLQKIYKNTPIEKIPEKHRWAFEMKEHHNDPNFPGGPAIHNLLDKVAEDWGTNSDLYNQLEDTIVGYADEAGNLTRMGKAEVKALLANYDVLDDYGPLLEPGSEKTMSSVKEVKLDYDFNEDELEGIIKTLKRHYGTLVNPINAMEKALGKKIPTWDDSIDEGQDHEVAMAHNSLESIIKSAMELKAKIGNDERDIPGWIQDHITNAENYIDQAAQGFHELDNHESDMDELPVGNEEEPIEDMTLQSLMQELMKYKKAK